MGPKNTKLREVPGYQDLTQSLHKCLLLFFPFFLKSLTCSSIFWLTNKNDLNSAIVGVLVFNLHV